MEILAAFLVTQIPLPDLSHLLTSPRQKAKSMLRVLHLLLVLLIYDALTFYRVQLAGRQQ